QPPPPGCQEEQSTSVEIIPDSQQASPSTKSWSGNFPLKVQHPTGLINLENPYQLAIKQLQLQLAKQQLTQM
ncbi:hypothetical protein J6590_107961, partial [Homalodisca vitripennis]